MGHRIFDSIVDIVHNNILKGVHDTNTPLNSGHPEVGAAVVAESVKNELAPVVEHLANREPWYQSRVTIGSIVAIAFPSLRMIGLEMGWVTQGEVVDILTNIGGAAGGLFALYGRLVARKPLSA